MTYTLNTDERGYHVISDVTESGNTGTTREVFRLAPGDRSFAEETLANLNAPPLEVAA